MQRSRSVPGARGSNAGSNRIKQSSSVVKLPAISGGASQGSRGKPGLQKSGSEPQLRSNQQKDSQKNAVNSSMEMLDYKPREVRRTILETLANPDVMKIARKLYEDNVGGNYGRLGFKELRGVLHQLTKKLGMPAQTEKEAERLFKRYDINGDGTLEFNEFFELFMAALRRMVFEPNNLLGRGFFVRKEQGDVWQIYKQQKELGRGSFGAAYLCKHRQTGKERVVKAVKKSQAKLPVEDIEKEIMIMRQIDHPHVLRLFEWYEDQRQVYLVIEVLKGGTLREVILYYQRKGQDIQEQWSRTVMQQALQAMAYCHSLRLVHKDLKDENIMLLKKDPPFAVIIDLGISEMFAKHETNSRVIAGTPTTMAPEVWMQNFGPKCDVWSLGCILYELLAGAMPFMVNSMEPREWVAAHKRGPNWSLVRSSKPGRRCCEAMLTVNDAKRPSTAACLTHEWFSTDENQLSKLKADQLGPLKAFCQQSSMKRYLLLEIASKLPIEKAARAVEIFQSFDANNDATLSPAELKAAFAKIGIKDEELVKKTFKAMDMDCDGALSFTEFSAGALLLFKDMLDDGLQQMFFDQDRDRDGAINKNELQALLSKAAYLSKVSPDDVVSKLFGKEKSTIRYEDLRQQVLGNMS